MKENLFEQIRKECQGEYFKKEFDQNTYYYHVTKIQQCSDKWVMIISDLLCDERLNNKKYRYKESIYFVASLDQFREHYGERIKPVEFLKQLENKYMQLNF